MSDIDEKWLMELVSGGDFNMTQLALLERMRGTFHKILLRGEWVIMIGNTSMWLLYEVMTQINARMKYLNTQWLH